VEGGGLVFLLYFWGAGGGSRIKGGEWWSHWITDGRDSTEGDGKGCKILFWGVKVTHEDERGGEVSRWGLGGKNFLGNVVGGRVWRGIDAW